MKKENKMVSSLKPTLLALALMASFQAMAEVTPAPPGDISQSVTNIAPVLNTSNVPVVVSADGGSSTFNPLNLQAGSTVSVTATGAAASVSVSAVNSAFMTPVSGIGSVSSIGNIIQNVSNSSTTPSVVVGGPTGVNNYFLNGEDTKQPLIVQLGASSSASVGGLIGIGASVSIAATGAVASVSVSGISADGTTTTLALPTIGSISQYVPGTFQPGVINSATVTNTGTINTIGNMMPGSSASISASGAVASVGLSVLAANDVNTGGTPASVTPITTTAASIGQIGQFVVNTNTANVTNIGTVTMATPVTSSENLLLDVGSTVSISATGAAAAVSVGMINSSLTSPGWTVGPVVQVSDNSALINNNGTFTAGANIIASSGAALPTLGRGASVSIGATGAAASFSISALSGSTESSVTPPSNIGGTFYDSSTPTPYSTGISQGVQNTAQVTNVGSIQSLGNMEAGSSASVSATGAVASIGFSANNANMSGPATILGVGQVVKNLADGSTNYYNQNTGSITAGNLGEGASVSVGSTGAVASLNVSAIDGTIAGLNIASAGNNPIALIPVSNNPVAPNNLAIYQGAENNKAIVNTGTISTGNLDTGASASISASAAVTSISFSVIDGTANGTSIGSVGTPSIQQNSFNTGNVANTSQSTFPTAALTVGSIGNGASASISASGAVASTSVSLNNSAFDPLTTQGFVFGDIQQTATNYNGSVTNAAGALPLAMSVFSLPGTGASASISASGAVASVSYSSIQGQGQPITDAYRWDQQFGAVNQTATNLNVAPPTGGNIVNNGVIVIGSNVANVTGVNSSASVGATGAATSFSVSSIADPVVTNGLTTGPITQVASNAGVINNTGSITFVGGNSATLGVGSSVSVSATGAVSSVSYRAVNTARTPPV